MFLYIDNLKNNELSIVSSRLKEDLKQGSNLNEVIKQQLEIAKPMLMELFKKLHQNVVFLVEEKELKSLPKSLVIGEFPKYELNTTNFKKIYNMMKERKRTYTEEEVNELKKWFDSQELPPTMQIDKAAFTPNLKDTVDMLFEQAYVCYENPKMQGCLYLLEKIKSNLEKNGTGA